MSSGPTRNVTGANIVERACRNIGSSDIPCSTTDHQYTPWSLEAPVVSGAFIHGYNKKIYTLIYEPILKSSGPVLLKI